MPQSYSTNFGTVPPGIRLDGVPGADKRPAWHSRSDSDWDVF